MNGRLLTRRRGSGVTIIIGLLACSILMPPSTRAADAEGSDAANNAKNVARINCGTRIDWISPGATGLINISSREQTASAESLLLDDQTLNCRLSRGDNTFVLTLPRISLLNRFSFINEQATASGSVEIFVSNYRLSPNDSRWQTTNQNVSFSGRRFVNVSLVGIEAKYIRILFHVEKEGAIAGLGLYGQATLQAFAKQQKNDKQSAVSVAYTTPALSQDGLNFNFANVYAKARVIYTSSGPADGVYRMIDDDSATEFAFAPGDTHPTVIIELAESERLRRISAVYEMEAGQLDIYLFNQLPADRSDFGGAKPVVSVADATAAGKAAADFDPRGARYVALRWTPNESRRAGKTFKIAEIGAFGDMTFAHLELNEFPDRLAENSGVPNVPVEPPVVVPVSP
ncbi:MAG: hypothetical protein QOG67_2812 [Verrucomicrobiota bacterium]|jgi:hypothetical protein